MPNATNANKKTWNVMVYLAGDNNLSVEMVYALTDMFPIAISQEFKAVARVVAQFDPNGTVPRRFNFSEEPEYSLSSNGPVTTSSRRLTLEDFGRKIPEDRILESIKANLRRVSPTGKGQARAIAIDPLTEYIKKLNEQSTPINLMDAIIKHAIEQPDDLNSLGDGLQTTIPSSAEAVTLGAFVKQLIEDSANPIVLEEFITSNIQHPENGYYNMLVLSGHGDGALGDFLTDTDPSGSLSIPRLRAVLEEVTGNTIQGNQIDILGMDSCLMSMIEVAYEVRKTVKFLVGAEGFELNAGWPFHRVLEALRRTPEPKELTTAIVEEYIHYYTDYEIAGVSTDLSACDLSQLDSLISDIGSLADLLCIELNEPYSDSKRPILDAILSAHWDAQSYKREQYVDLYDFCSLLSKRFEDGQADTNVPQTLKEEVVKCCRQIMTAVDRVVLLSCYSGPAFQHSHGLSIYFPWAEIEEDLREYRNLLFAQYSHWHDFLKIYLSETRRPANTKFGHKKIISPSDPIVIVRTGTPLGSKTGTPLGSKADIEVASMKNRPREFGPSKCQLRRRR